MSISSILSVVFFFVSAITAGAISILMHEDARYRLQDELRGAL